MNLIKMLTPPVKAVIIAVLFASLGLSLSAATECVWIGGEDGNISDATNWDPQQVPSSKSTTAYIAVFTNSVSLSNTESYWYPAGIRVSGNSTVVCNGNSTNNRIMACEVCENDEMVIDVATGSSLTFAKTASNSIFYGQDHLTLVKRGGGDFVSAYWLGQTQYPFKEIELEGGTISGTKNRTVVTDRIHICSGTVLQAGCSNFAGSTNVVPVIDVEAGGLFDCNGLAQLVASLSGAGVVSNLSTKTLTLNLVHTAEAFTGRIYGTLLIKALAGSTVPGSNLVIGSADALADASFSITDVAGVPAGVVFSPEIGTFYAKGFPSDRIFYDTEGVPVTVVKSGNFWYVDCKRTGEPGDGKSPETAFQTLAEASTNAALAAYDTIFVAPGIYSNGVVEVVQNNITTFNRVMVPVNVRLVATGSKEETIILGADSPNPVANCHGDGPNAVRCVWLGAYATLSGFTVTGGRVHCTASNVPDNAPALGGGIFSDSESAKIIDCVISNNVAVRGGGAQKGSFFRCSFLGNRATQISASAYDKCYLYNCVLSGGLGSYEWYSSGVGAAVNCTFGLNSIGCVRGGNKTVDAERMHLYNCVVLSAPVQNKTSSTNDAAVFHNCLIARRGSATDPIVEDDCIVTNLTDSADILAFAGVGANLRPLSIRSRVVDAANLDYYTNNFPIANYAESILDLDGQVRVMNGRLDLGAYEFDTTCTRVVVKVAADGMDATGIDPGETVVLAPGKKLTYTLTRNFRSARLCTGFSVNGVFHDFDDYPDGWTHTVTGNGYAADETVEAVYAEKSDWYIDPVKGRDGNPGYHRLCPKKSFEAVMDCASAGETVWALPGVYSNGTMNCSANQDARVVVKENVTLAAFGSREETIIEGAPAKPENEVAYGCGTGAVRCVYLQTGAKIKGFTIRNGYTFCYLDKDGRPNSGVNGGGIMGVKDQVKCFVSAEDCFVTNCWAVRGGGVSGGVACTRCEFRGNGCTYIGGAANYCVLTNCLFGGNARSYVTLYCNSVVNCTFLSDNAGDCVHQSIGGYSSDHVVNCAIMSSPRDVPEYTRCVFNSEKTIKDENLGEGSFKLSPGDFKVDAMGRPLAGSPLVDAALALAYPNAANDVDCDGSQRVYNAKLDIGAFEYDWRGDFAKRIKRSRKFAVTEASSAVTTNELGQVKLTDGTTLAAEWTNVPDLGCRYAATVQVFGEGALTVRFDGEPVGSPIAATDDPVVVGMTAPGGEAKHRFDFSFTGAGHAVIGGFSGPSAGMLLLVR